MWSGPQSDWKAWLAEFTGDRVDPERSTSPWSGHREFAYDLIRWRQPDVIVELGTHYGASFFAFCQAVTDAGADAELHAIDTWQGDEHAGFYDESVFESFQNSARAFPSVRIRLHRSTFLEALDEFEDDSVDLLHIDGLHTYEALKEDYESWLPKLAAGGVVLLHDVNPDSGYGSATYYAQHIADSVPGFSFPHNFGLGVVFPKGTQGWEPVLSDSFAGWRHFYPERAEARLLRVVERDQAAMIDERASLIAQYETKIIQYEGSRREIARHERALERNAAESKAMEAALRTTTRQLRQARDRVHQLTPLESSPKAQLRALRRSLPRSLATRAPRSLKAWLKRHRASLLVTRAGRRRLEDAAERPVAERAIDSALATRASLEEILSGVLARYPRLDRSEAERRLFAGIPLNPDHAARMAGSSRRSQNRRGRAPPGLLS